VSPVEIIQLAFDLTAATQRLVDQVRRFYYWVMLFGHCCPQCTDTLTMVAEGRCQCRSCGHELDPTITFQSCPDCGGVPERRIRRYQCRQCGHDITSKFLFDGLVFDAEYFRAKMSESRHRKREQRERVRQLLAESRSGVLSLEQADLGAMPGLVDALNALTIGGDEVASLGACIEFDLKRYENHIQAHIHDSPLSLTEIPPLSEDARKDLIWRFVAAIFLAHMGIIRVWQEGRDVMVIQYETDRERQDVPGEPEGADGVEGPLGGVEAC